MLIDATHGPVDDGQDVEKVGLQVGEPRVLDDERGENPNQGLLPSAPQPEQTCLLKSL